MKKINGDVILKSVEAVKKVVNDELVGMFAKEVGWDEEELKACVFSALMTTAQSIGAGVIKLKIKKPDGEEPKGEEPEKEEPKPEGKRQKQKKGEDEKEFLKRVCFEASDEFLNTFEEFGLSEDQAEKCVLLCVVGMIEAFELEHEVLGTLLSRLAK